MDSKYRLINSLTGWVVFFISLLVYTFTLEPTVSFWDCGEFIASAYKLEVGHPPGAPLWMILARVFALFAGDPSQAAYMINFLSGLVSAFTILFLFWSITHLARKVVLRDAPMDAGRLIAVIGSGVVGALAYTFSDTFWFSAVEAEVYATSSLFTAVVFWAILKWESMADEPGANRWLILIAFLMGLSVGVHLLNLLAIPAIVFVYYFRKYAITRRGIIKTSLVAVVLLGTLVYIIIPGAVKLATYFELLFVNGFSMPYNSGLFIYIVLLAAGLAAGLYYSHTKKKQLVNTLLLALTVILVGYSSFAMIMIRSAANPPMDENNPEDVHKLLYYLNREQYGDRPLAYGQYYSAPVLDVKEKAPKYIRKDGTYQVSSHSLDYEYDKRFLTLFPRMWSNRPEHIEVYREWGKVKGQPVRVRNRAGEMETISKPTFAENLRFFFSYQLGHMYFRYFMWNFAGRQNDEQGHGNILNGNWISGIRFIDNLLVGPQDKLPSHQRDNRSRNTYYFLPLLLGLAGLFYQYRCHSRDFLVVVLLFFFTGIAIVIYLNQYPYQPRERDYAYAGSFYAFCIWIGLGVPALWEALRKTLPSATRAVAVSLVSLALVPGIMAVENRDDHDRSGRYTARDLAFNYLNTCEPDAILITNGDNDTFPLWYAQEVEGVRTDVRVLNMMLFNTDWYIDQMQTRAYSSAPLPVSIPPHKYLDGVNNQIYIREVFKQPAEMKDVVEWIKSANPRTKLQTADGEMIDFIPTKTIRIPVDRQKVLANGTVPPGLADQIVPYIDVTLKGSYLLKNQMMLLDLIAANNWERPIYFVSGGHEDAMGLEDYFQLEGFAYRLVPVKTSGRNLVVNFGRLNTERLYENLMEKFVWGNMNDPDVFLDYTTIRTFQVIRIRNKFIRLANALVSQGDSLKAGQVLDRAMELMPPELVQYDIYINEQIRAYFRSGREETAIELATNLIAYQKENLDYMMTLTPRLLRTVDYELRIALQTFQETISILEDNGLTDLSSGYEQEFNNYYILYLQKTGNM